MFKETNTSNFWYYVLSLIGTFLIVFFTWRIAKLRKQEMKETHPIITLLGFTPILKNIHFFEIIIANNKPHNIVLKNIKYKKASRFNLFNKYKRADWTFPEKTNQNKNTWLSNTNVVTIIKDEQKFAFDIPNFDPATKYKIVVETSTGNCQACFPKILDSSREKSSKFVSEDIFSQSKDQSNKLK